MDDKAAPRAFYKLFSTILLVSLMLSSVGSSLPIAVRAQEAATEPPPPPTPEAEPTEVTGQIVGGAPADPGEWPWQAALVYDEELNPWYGQFCGGSLVSNTWVVTAAHCVYGVTISDIDVVVGIYDLWAGMGYQRRNLSQIIIHPSYNYATSDSDIALLQLSSAVSIGGSGATKTAIVPPVMPTIGTLVGVSSWVTGWGDTESTPQYPDQLYEVQVPIIANSVCNNVTHYNGKITANMMCAGYEAGGHDSCQGDSGGPLVISDSGEWKLAGIVSWGTGCADPMHYGVYTRVSNFTDWILGYAGVTISGTAGVGGATITWAGPKASGSVVADGTGAFSFKVPYGWGGTVTPSKTGYIFEPATHNIVSATVHTSMGFQGGVIGDCYTLAYAVSPLTAGTIAVDVAPNCAGGEYTWGTRVEITETTSPGYTLSGWMLDGYNVGMGPSIVTIMYGDRNATAYFMGGRALIVTLAGAGSGSVSSSPPGIDCPTDCLGTYATNTVVTLSATPSAGSTFAGWGGPTDCQDGVVSLAADTTCLATFDLLPAYEPNDEAGDATPIQPATPQVHSLSIGDVDWIQFDLASDSNVTLRTMGPHGSGNDTRLWLYDSSLTELNYSDIGDPSNYSLIRQCGTSKLPAGTYYMKVDENGNDDAIDAYTVLLSRTCRATTADFDGPGQYDHDGMSDVVIYRGGAWLPYDFTTGAYMAANSKWTGNPGGACIPAPMDYDGDGAVEYTQLCGGAWNFYNDNGSLNKGIWVGDLAGQRPVPADYDGDGTDDIVVFKAGAWLYYDFATGANVPARNIWTGYPGGIGIPVPVDTNGDGSAEPTILSGGAWHFYNANGLYNKGIWVGNIAGQLPVPGDYNGDGTDDVWVYRAGAWLPYDFATGAYLAASSVWTGNPPAPPGGGATKPAPLDYDGDGTLDLTVFAGGPWHFYNDNGSYLKGIWVGKNVVDKPISRRALP